MNETTEVNPKAKKDVETIATEHVVNYLKKGIVPWLTPFIESGIPQNVVNRLEYRELNIFLLASLGYKKNFFITAKQLEEHGGTVKKDEKGHPVFYWKWLPDQEGEESDKKKRPVLRYFYVYNIAQCDGLKKGLIPKIILPEDPLQVCVAMVANMPKRPEITHGSPPAAYVPTLDAIDIPEREDFPSDESYYCTLFRALVRSTGHEKRLNRKDIMETTLTNEEAHRTEDLISELGASYLASFAGIPYGGAIDREVYMTTWVEKFEKNPKLIVYAGTQAQRAVDYILNRSRKGKNGKS